MTTKATAETVTFRNVQQCRQEILRCQKNRNGDYLRRKYFIGYGACWTFV